MSDVCTGVFAKGRAQKAETVLSAVSCPQLNIILH